MKNQEQCGSYWAFSNTSSLEDDWFIVASNLPSLCEQQLVDFVTVDSAGNCGLVDNGYGTCKASCYTVGDRTGKCHGIQGCVH